MAEPGSIQWDIEKQYRLYAYHQRISPLCSHSSELDLFALRARFGPDFNLVDQRGRFLRLLRCTKCGERGKHMTISLSPPANFKVNPPGWTPASN